MSDTEKTKEQLIEELEALRARVAECEQAQVALEESERKFRGLAEAITAHICIAQDQRFLYANQAYLDYFGIERDELHLITPGELMMGNVDPE